jgi:DNA-binding MarR family transcriptional regulator
VSFLDAQGRAQRIDADAIAGCDETVLSVSAIARRSELHVATASRIVGELVSHGLLERAPTATCASSCGCGRWRRGHRPP